MALTYPISLPDTTSIQEVEFRPNSIVAVTKSEFTGSSQKHKHDGQWWTVRGVIIPKTKADGQDWSGFFMSLNGSEGTFLFGDPHNTTAQGTASSAPGTPLVNGASQTGDQLIMDGAPNNITGYLLRGDWIQLGSAASARLYRIKEDANSNGSGEITLEIWPDLRSSPGNNDAITVASTLGVFQLTDAPSYRINAEHLYIQNFTAEEAI